MNGSDEIKGFIPPRGINELADKIREAIGASPSEPVEIYAPPHRSRMDGKEVTYAPVSLQEFEALRTLPKSRLVELGLRSWDENGLMLFPVEWYDLIPEGFELVSIFGEREEFHRGKTDNDCRYGVLAYGIIAR